MDRVCFLLFVVICNMYHLIGVICIVFTRKMYHLIHVRCIIFPATIFFMLPGELNFVFVCYSIPLNDVMPPLSASGVLTGCKGYGRFIYLKII